MPSSGGCQDLISNSPYCLPYGSCDVSLENLVLDQLIIPFLRLSFILITCLLDIVLTLLGEILSWSLVGVKGLICREKFSIFHSCDSEKACIPGTHLPSKCSHYAVRKFDLGPFRTVFIVQRSQQAKLALIMAHFIQHWDKTE